MLLFAMGLFTGGLFGAGVMCLLQLSRTEEHLTNAEKGSVK